MSDNIYRKATNTLEMFNGRIANAYTKAQTDAKIDQINAKFNDNADYLKSKNMCNPYDSSKLLNATVSSTLNSNSYACTYYCEIKPNTSYTVSRSVFGRRWSIGLTDSISMGTYVYNLVENDDTTTPTVTIENTNHTYLVMYFWVDVDTYTKDTILKSIQIEEGDTATAYAPFRKSNVDIIKDIAELATVAKTGSYNDLSNKPTLGTAAAKNYTTNISNSNADLPTSGSVFSFITYTDISVSKSVAQKNDFGVTCAIPSGYTPLSVYFIASNDYPHNSGCMSGPTRVNANTVGARYQNLGIATITASGTVRFYFIKK